ncbi:hypothetical protein [Kineosporia succinea]|uniref:Uncharacterized protein n=1 Tax=Kineosporia succinea TaxID=84632 RepID=A0ABT9NXQ5_9ACTN|nr:hypothetical protein [Kineosporia succinea]MDP9825218.1 hypothetical protein [Kineosporia succinea]
MRREPGWSSGYRQVWEVDRYRGGMQADWLAAWSTLGAGVATLATLVTLWVSMRRERTARIADDEQREVAAQEDRQRYLDTRAAEERDRKRAACAALIAVASLIPPKMQGHQAAWRGDPVRELFGSEPQAMLKLVDDLVERIMAASITATLFHDPALTPVVSEVTDAATAAIHTYGRKKEAQRGEALLRLEKAIKALREVADSL